MGQSQSTHKDEKGPSKQKALSKDKCEGYGTLMQPKKFPKYGIVGVPDWPSGVAAGVVVGRWHKTGKAGPHPQIALELPLRVHKRYHWSYPQVPCRARTLWIGEEMLLPFEPPGIDFPLLSLPPAVLACVWLQFKISEGAYYGRTCKATMAAFRDEVSWKRRAMQDSPKKASSLTLSSERWFAHGYLASLWCIYVETVFPGGGSGRKNPRVEVRIRPEATIHDLYRVLATVPQSDGILVTYPFHIVKDFRLSSSSPTCTFASCPYDSENTLVSVGLCDGAIIEKDMEEAFGD